MTFALILPRAKTMANVFQLIRWKIINYFQIQNTTYKKKQNTKYRNTKKYKIQFNTQGPVCDCTGLAFEGVFCDQGEFEQFEFERCQLGQKYSD